jgi:hypothetical protein
MFVLNRVFCCGSRYVDSMLDGCGGVVFDGLGSCVCAITTVGVA